MQSPDFQILESRLAAMEAQLNRTTAAASTSPCSPEHLFPAMREIPGAGICPWWRARIKPGDPTKAQISGGYVNIDTGGQGSYLMGIGPIQRSGLGGGSHNVWTDVDISSAAGTEVIYFVHDGCHPYNRTPVLKIGEADAGHLGTHPDGAWKWLPVAQLGGSTPNFTIKATWVGGRYMSSSVVPVGTLGVWASGSPPPGWAVLDGTGGTINAAQMGIRHIMTAAVGPLTGTIDGTVAVGAHTHSISTGTISGTSGSDNLGMRVTSATSGAPSGLEYAVAGVFAIKL